MPVRRKGWKIIESRMLDATRRRSAIFVARTAALGAAGARGSVGRGSNQEGNKVALPGVGGHCRRWGDPEATGGASTDKGTGGVRAKHRGSGYAAMPQCPRSGGHQATSERNSTDLLRGGEGVFNGGVETTGDSQLDIICRAFFLFETSVSFFQKTFPHE